MRLLLVEDDPMIGKSMRRGLEQAGFSADWARDALADRIGGLNVGADDCVGWPRAATPPRQFSRHSSSPASCSCLRRRRSGG